MEFYLAALPEPQYQPAQYMGFAGAGPRGALCGRRLGAVERRDVSL
jgi:hypothetical protein